mmetsp:Transcript_66421/g.176642  ORF Transcript_66421/g.176642 Transcript_66421/m.176642 type:complete len:256 (+) Transcript_66421:349-1116(+)
MHLNHALLQSRCKRVFSVRASLLHLQINLVQEPEGEAPLLQSTDGLLPRRHRLAGPRLHSRRALVQGRHAQHGRQHVAVLGPVVERVPQAAPVALQHHRLGPPGVPYLDLREVHRRRAVQQEGGARSALVHWARQVRQGHVVDEREVAVLPPLAPDRATPRGAGEPIDGLPDLLQGGPGREDLELAGRALADAEQRPKGALVRGAGAFLVQEGLQPVEDRAHGRQLLDEPEAVPLLEVEAQGLLPCQRVPINERQ